MLTDARRFFYQELFSGEIEGGVCKDMSQIIDELTEEDNVLDKEFRDNEMEICGIFDDGWFTCCGCGWTMPISEVSDREDDLECVQCSEELG